MAKLTGKQARYLRGLGHHLNPTLIIGKEELSEGVVAEADLALNSRELIKVKLLESCLRDRQEVAGELAEKTGAEIAQILGRTFLLYRPSKEKIIKLPA